MPRLLLTGTYCSKNKGDAALFLSMAAEARRQIPGLDVSLGSPFPHLDRSLYEPLGIEVFPSHRRKLGRCLLQMLLGGRGPALGGVLRSPDLESTARVDAVVDLSGDGLTEDYGPHVVLSHLYPIWAALRLGKPLALCSQTIGPFRLLSPLVRTLLSQARLITARDRFTLEQLERLGVRGPRIELTSDIAHLLEAAPPETLESQLGDYPRSFFERPVLGVTLSRLLGNRQSLGAKPDRFVGLLAQVFRSLIERHGLNLLLLSHSTGPKPSRDDRWIAQELSRILELPERVYFEARDLEPSLLKALIGKCQAFLGMRLHSVIAALSMEVPCVVLGYGPKAQGLLEHWELAGQGLSVSETTGERLLGLLDGTLAGRDELKLRIREKKAGVLDLARANVQHVRALFV